MVSSSACRLPVFGRVAFSSHLQPFQALSATLAFLCCLRCVKHCTSWPLLSPILSKILHELLKTPLFLISLRWPERAPPSRKTTASNGRIVALGDSGKFPLTNLASPRICGLFSARKQIRSAEGLCLSPQRYLSNPIHSRYLSSREFLNPALFFFANFPSQGHNVRGVPKEP